MPIAPAARRAADPRRPLRPPRARRPLRLPAARPARPRDRAKPPRAPRPRATPRPAARAAARAKRSNRDGRGARETGRLFFFGEINLKPVVAALLACGALAGTAHAATRAESALECGVAADMAVVAH